MKTGSSIKDYSRVITQISSKIVENLAKNERFEEKDSNGDSSKSTAIEAKCEVASKIEDQSKPKTLFYFDHNFRFNKYIIDIEY